MNSFTPKQNLCTKKPYGLNLEKNKEIFKKMKATALNIRCTGKLSLQTFQKGIMFSISLELLYEELKSNYDISHLISSRLNQHSLESFFLKFDKLVVFKIIKLL